jgi:hypothetical protein
MKPQSSQSRVPVHEITLALTVKDGSLTVLANSDEHGSAKAHVEAWRTRNIKAVVGSIGESTVGTEKAAHDITDALFHEDAPDDGPSVLEWLEGVVEELEDRYDDEWRLRLRLILHESTLGEVPWELARLPGQLGNRLLVADTHFSLVRDVADTTARPPAPRFPPPLRVLHASALAVEDHPELRNGDGESLARLEAKHQGLQVETLSDVTATELALALRVGVDVFHFSGHGVNDDADAGIVVNAKRGVERGDHVMGKGELVAALARPEEEHVPRAKVVVLACCHAGRENDEAEDANWSGVASALVKDAHVPFVIAMQQAIEDRHASTFTRHFYRALVTTGSVDEAVAAGREALGGVLAAIPVVYSRARSAEVSVASAAAAASAPKPLPAPERKPERAAPAAPMRPTVSPRLTVPVGSRVAVVSRRGGRSVAVSVGRQAVELKQLSPDRSLTPWRIGAPVDGVELAQAGGYAVALASGALYVAQMRDNGDIASWSESFAVPDGYDRLLAVRRSERGRSIIEALVAGEVGHAVVTCRADRPAAPRSEIAATRVHDAAATGDGFLIITEAREFVAGRAVPRELASVATEGWCSVDHAACGGVGVTAAARVNGHGAVIHVLVDGQAPRMIGLPAVERVRVVRPLDKTPPEAIVAQVGDELHEWPISALPVERDA